jgi:hypothetical protein
MSGYNTTWKTGKRVIRLKDVIRYLNKKRRRVHYVSAQSLHRALNRRLKTNRNRMMSADIDVPIIVVLNRETRRPVVVLDGNHRLAKAVSLGLDIGIRIMYKDEYDSFFGG